MDLKNKIIFPALLIAVVTVACAGMKGSAGETAVEKQGILIPPVRYVDSDEKKQWEGVIDGRAAAYFRPAHRGGMIDVLVVTEGELPGYFKRIEYFDMNSDGDVDSVRMMIFEKDRGWREVGITKENKYGLGYADTQYKELMRRISMPEEPMR